MLFMRFMKGELMSWYSIPLYFVQLAFGGMAIGWIVGKVMNFLLKHTTNATSEIMITITCAYSTFILAEACRTSGVLAVVLLGFTMAKGGQVGVYFIDSFCVCSCLCLLVLRLQWYGIDCFHLQVVNRSRHGWKRLNLSFHLPLLFILLGRRTSQTAKPSRCFGRKPSFLRTR